MNIQETSVSGDTKYGALCVDMGLTCFAELKDYERSREYFAQAGEAKLSPVYCRLAQYMGKQDIKDEELLRLLSDAGAGIEDCTDVRFVQSLLQVYGKMEEVKGRLSQDQYMTMALLGEKGKHMDEWKEKDPNHEKEKELCMYQVKGYEGSGELEKAEQPCFEWLELETDQGKREEICLKLSKIYESEGKMEEAREACASEIQKNETSKKLRILFIRLQCQDPGIERTVCASTIKEFLDQIPELAEEGEFLEIQEEYGIKIETDNVSFEV